MNLFRFKNGNYIDQKFKERILLLVALVLALPVDVKAYTYNIVSDTTCTVSTPSGNPLGNAQNVCLNSNFPSPCPAGATQYGYTLTGWTANLSTIPGAKWIWAPNITGATSGAANAEFIFEKQFWICGNPVGATISVAADNSAEVLLNGTSVFTSTNHSALSTVTIPNATIPLTVLKQGPNTIKVKAKNGANPPDCGSDQYRCNPAGVVFGASFKDDLATLPTCPGGAPAGTIQQLSPCPAGTTGTHYQVCICFSGSAIWLEQTNCMPSAVSPTPTPVTLRSVTPLPVSPTPVAPPVSPTPTPTPVNVGDWCGDINQGQVKRCPSGTTCSNRLVPTSPRPWTCVLFGINCPVRLRTTDWYCDPD